MRHYERLAEQDRLSRSTIVDALEVLRQLAGFTDDDRAVIRIGPFRLPSGELVGLVDILFEAASQAKICVVSLPTASQFMAIRPGYSRRDRFDIARLDGTAVDGAGKVVLADGRRLRAVEVMPAHLPLEPSELDWRIPQNEAGTRIEPPVSLPRAKSQFPDAVAEAEPLDEPPGIRPGARGLTGVP
jgi:hypothetical protein